VGCVSAWWRWSWRTRRIMGSSHEPGVGLANSCALMIASYASVGKRSSRRRDRRRRSRTLARTVIAAHQR
jgi:hypothetical protein